VSSEDLAQLGSDRFEVGPSDRLAGREELRVVAAALELLPGPQRRALLLATWHGYTAQEVADVEDIPLGTAKTRIRTALLRLRSARVEADRGPS
jgi:RNA polymerase sigma-70 factor (ECF subfamily)